MSERDCSDKMTTNQTMMQMIYIRGRVCLTSYIQAIDKWSGAFGQGYTAGSVNNDAARF